MSQVIGMIDEAMTYVANILLAVNPYEDIKDMYSSTTIKKYQGKSLGELPPHSQSIIVSGESGAGKTESTKYILKYLCDLWAKGAGPVEQKILDEAFGNAKTTRNNNSSRFGKFMEVHFSSKYQVVGGHISHYLLEKSRICMQSAEERNYHYLKNGCTQYFTTADSEKKISANRKSKQQQAKGGLRDPILDDVEDFQRLHQGSAENVRSEQRSRRVGESGVQSPVRLHQYFQMNSFEQFCINYCNEKLQQFFNERILKNEQELYKREGLNVPEIRFVDNQDCIELYKREGLNVPEIRFVDNQDCIARDAIILASKTYCISLTDLIESKNHGIFHYLDEESKLPKPEFGHFTHSVCFQNQFIEKNNDALHASLEFLVQESNSALVQQLFQTSDNNNAKGKLNFISVGAKFQSQLSQLMDKLKENPNSRMVGGALEGSLVLTQLQCSGTTAVLELMEHGYPSRAPFHDLHNMYKTYLPPKLQSLSPKVFCEAIVHSFGLSDKDYKFGVTRVFFRPGKYSEFDTMMKSDPENLRSIVDAVLSWLVKSRWRKSIFAVLSIIKLKNKILYRRECLILIQKTVRGYLVRRKHRPRYKAIAKITALQNNLKEMDSVTSQLKTEKANAQKNIENLRSSIRTACATIKSNPNITAAEIDKLYSKMTKDIESQMSSLQKYMVDQKNSKAEMEARRKAEEAERLRLEEQDRIAAQKLQVQMEAAAKADLENRESSAVHKLQVQMKVAAKADLENRERSERVRMQQAMAGKQKYDLSKWKYSELRDTINTSCDIELLEKGDILGARHRYFRIPFVRPSPGGVGSAPAEGERRGWWYAHFDGQYVARQMELHPDKTPVLLQA
ncbi:Myosin vi, partial [Operophtera brumata]